MRKYTVIVYRDTCDTERHHRLTYGEAYSLAHRVFNSGNTASCELVQSGLYMMFDRHAFGVAPWVTLEGN